MRGLSLAWLAAVPFAAYTTASAISLQHDVQSLPEESIRAALEKTLSPKYREGVFEHGDAAIEMIHSMDPALASQVINVAKQERVQRVELGRRQATDNVTVTTVTDNSVVVVSVVTSTATDDSRPPSSPTSAPAESTTSRTVPVASSAVVQQSETELVTPTLTTTVQPDGKTTTISQNAVITSASVSMVVPVTSTNAQGAVVTTSSTVPAIVLSSTDAAGLVRSTTSPLSSAVITSPRILTSASLPASASLKTTTDANGHVIVVTVFPGGETSEIVVQTSIGADGQRRTITSYKQVGPSTTSSADTPTSSEPSATLAAGIAGPTAHIGSELVILVCGAVIGAAALI